MSDRSCRSRRRASVLGHFGPLESMARRRKEPQSTYNEPMHPYGARLRSLSQLFFAAIAAYLLNAMLAARIARALAPKVAGLKLPLLQLLCGALIIDGSKVAGFSLVAWVVGRAVLLPPLSSALSLVGLATVWELVVNTVLGQSAALWGRPAVLLLRLAILSGLVWVTSRIFTRQYARGSSNAPSEPPPQAHDAPPESARPGPEEPRERR